MPDRDHYLDASPDSVSARAEYQARIARVLELAGFDRGAPRAEAVWRSRPTSRAATRRAEASADERNADNLWTRADFARRAPGMDWTAFFTAAGLSKQRRASSSGSRGAIEGAAKLVDSQPLATWKDYLRFRTIDLARRRVAARVRAE